MGLFALRSFGVIALGLIASGGNNTDMVRGNRFTPDEALLAGVLPRIKRFGSFGNCVGWMNLYQFVAMMGVYEHMATESNIAVRLRWGGAGRTVCSCSRLNLNAHISRSA